MKRWLKWIGIVCLIPVALILSISILLYIPPVQRFVVRKATGYARDASGMDITVGQVRLSFPLDLSLGGVEVVHPPADTLLVLQHLSVRVNPVPLFNKTVAVDKLRLQGIRLATGALIDGMEVKGVAGELSGKATVRLSGEKAFIPELKLADAAFTLLIDSTSSSDTTSAPVNWVLAVDKVSLEHICFGLQMPSGADTLRLGTYIGSAGVEEATVDLGKSRYAAGRLMIAGSSLSYDGDNRPAATGLDFAHLAMNKLNLSVDSLLYQAQETNMILHAGIKEFSLEERSGWVVSSLTGNIRSDTATISIPELVLKTPDSEVRLLATIPWSILNDVSEGSMQALLTASIGKTDLFEFVGGMPDAFVRSYPAAPLTLAADITGNLSALNIRQLKAELPGSLVVSASGKAGELTDSLRRSADIRLQAQGRRMDFALNLLPAGQREQFRIPQGMRLTGNIGLKDREFSTALLVTEDKASVKLDASYKLPDDSYRVRLKVDSLSPVRFMPYDSLMWVALHLRAVGKGTDPFDAGTWMDMSGTIDSVCYLQTELSDIRLTGSLKEHNARFELKSNDPAAAMDITLDGSLRKEEVKGLLIADIDSIDLYRLHLMTDTFTTSFQLFAEAQSDRLKNHRIDVTLGNSEIALKDGRFNPKTLTLHARSDEDTTRVSFHVGDLGIVLTGNAELQTMTDRFIKISEEIETQLREDSTINIASLRPSLPDMTLTVDAGRDNPVFRILQLYGLGFSKLRIDAGTSPEEGLRVDAGLYALHKDTFMIDTVRALIRPDAEGVAYQVDVLKNRYMRQQPFTASLKGSLKYRYADAEFTYKNDRNETGVLTGVRLTKEQEGVCLQLYPEQQIIAFNTFRLNPDNYIRMRSLKDIDANVRFTGSEDASLWFHTVDEGGDFPELHAELSHIDLKNVSDGFPQLPAMQGIFSADVRYAPTKDAFMVVVDANIDTLFYQKGRVGELMFNAVYLPLENENHQVDFHLSRDWEEIAVATAVYQSAKQRLEGDFNILDLPLPMLSPFIPDGMASLSGKANGHMQVSGTTDAPLLNGYMQFDSSAVYVDAAASSFRFDDKRIVVKNSLLTFDKYNLYAAGTNPFVIDGTINFSNLSRMTADLRLGGSNMQLLDARRTPESLVSGQLFADLNTTIKGPLQSLNIRGSMKLLGGTDLVYTMTESPLTVQDRLKDLVTFTSFSDTLMRRRRGQVPLPLGGMDMSMLIQIEPAVQVRVDLTPDRSSYATAVGGGDLSFQYTPQGEMFLNGRYTFTEGEVHYALPVIPLKEFRIGQDSYVQWDGELMNPILNVKATQRMRASAASGGGSPQMVSFDVGLNIQERLDNMQLAFLISAPENRDIQNDIVAMGAEERAKVALAMMATGRYIYGGGAGNMNLDVNGALNSLLTSEINNIAGDALKTVDISFGMESYEDQGDTKRDYSLQFAKRFYNDRIRVMIGGKVSTGNTQNTEPFLDNVSVEYRLDPAGTKNVKLFYDRNYESLLEGEIVETGAGIVFRKKVRWLREMFDFRKKKVEPVSSDEE